MNKNIILGENIIIKKYVILGEKSKDENPKKLIIGDNALIRSSTVIYLGSKIGNDFQTGHGVLIRENNLIGDNVSIGTNSTIESRNKIGNNVRIHSGCFLENVTLGNNVFIGPNTVFTDDIHPVCPRYKDCVGGPIVKSNVSIGANCTILPGVRIQKNSLVGAGSVVTKDVPENSVVMGNPAKIIKKIDELRCIKGYYKRPYEWRK